MLSAQIDDILEKIYANMSACHIKKGNWKRAVETADKVIRHSRPIIACAPPILMLTSMF